MFQLMCVWRAPPQTTLPGGVASLCGFTFSAEGRCLRDYGPVTLHAGPVLKQEPSLRNATHHPGGPGCCVLGTLA